jgi:hypothetical protein
MSTLTWSPTICTIGKQVKILEFFKCNVFDREDGGATYHTRFSSFEFVRGQEGDPWVPVVDRQAFAPQTQELYRREMEIQDMVNRTEMRSLETQPQFVTFSKAIDFLERNHNSEGSWLLVCETFDPHEPFFTQDEFQKLYTHLDAYRGPVFDWPPYAKVREDPAAVRHIQLQYAALVTMCDRMLGRLLDKMDELHLWDQCLLIVNTDHGLMLGEHDWWAKCIQPFYQEIAHVPLWIWDPSRPHAHGLQAHSLVQTIDLPATLLDYFGLPMPPHMQGRPLGPVLDADSPVRASGLFGIFGGHVNVTDGRYVYMRGSADEKNGPLFEYTLMPNRMKSRFSPKELAHWTKSLTRAPAANNGNKSTNNNNNNRKKKSHAHVGVAGWQNFPFAKGCPLLRVPARRLLPAAARELSLESVTLLFDLKQDPKQTAPLADPRVEAYMRGLLLELLLASHAPAEQYTRLGLVQHSEKLPALVPPAEARVRASAAAITAQAHFRGRSAGGAVWSERAENEGLKVAPEPAETSAGQLEDGANDRYLRGLAVSDEARAQRAGGSRACL